MRTIVERIRRIGRPAAVLLALTLLQATDAPAGTTIYDAPIVFTRASYYSGTPPAISSFDFAGSAPDGGYAPVSATSAAGPAYAIAKSGKGRHELQAMAVSSGDSAGGAQSYLRGVVTDDPSRPFVVMQVYFRAASSAVWPGRAGWELFVCQWSGMYGAVITDETGKVTGYYGPGCGQRYFRSLAAVRSEQGGSSYAEHVVWENDEIVRREISNDDVVQTSQETWIVGEIVVPNGAELVVWMYATASTQGKGATFMTAGGGVGNGLAPADLGSILMPHPDNPDASITWYAEEAPAEPPFGGFGPDDLAERGIDPQPFIDLELLEPPAPEVPCTGGTPIADAELTMSRGRRVAGTKLHLQGKITLPAPPLDAPLDPVARGARALLAGASGVLLDEMLPGGAFDPETSTGWRHRAGGKRWVFTRPASDGGIHRLTLKKLPKTENVYAFTVDARLATSVPTAADLPLQATLVLDPPVAEDGQCGSAPLGAGPGTPACETRKGPRLVCK